MRKISLEKCQENMKLAKTIFTDDGRILLSAGIALKRSFIERLKLCNLSEVYIDDEFSTDIEINDVVDERTRNEAKLLVKSVMEEYKVTQRFDADRVKSVVNRIIDELLYTRDIMVNLTDIKSSDDYTFSHSVNVCILSLITGIKLGLNQLRLKDLGIGALMHDIGKTLIPKEILNKASKLTNEEFEQIKKHTILGHEILKTNRDISITSAHVAIAHHERYDGSGYPLGTKGDNIHQFARIVAIADVYDALSSDRVYRKKMKPHEVLEYMLTAGEVLFDRNILEHFVRSIAIYSIGTSVVLNTGERGIVVDVNRTFPTRPIVRVVIDAGGKRLASFNEIDLTKRLNVFIEDTCDI